MGYSPWGCKVSAMTEQLHFHFLSSQAIGKPDTPTLIGKHLYKTQVSCLPTWCSFSYTLMPVFQELFLLTALL